MGRFNVNGNFIRAWNPWTEGEDNSGVAIIDCMMNLPLLYWASEETGDPRFQGVAKKHADMVLNHFVRSDGAVHHIVRFDPESGERIEAMGGQGYGPDSAWSRGNAWAIYGLTLSYEYTGEAKYLEAAKRVAHFFISHLPEDYVPNWDFLLPEDVDTPRDSSAGAIAASGLLLLAEKVSAPESPIYHRAGEKILESLLKIMAIGKGWKRDWFYMEQAISQNRSYLDNPLIYGDYYFVEGLARLKGYKELFW